MQQNKDTQPPRILLVDDEEEFLQVMAKRLTRRGFDVRGVSSGEDALAFLEDHERDVVVLDVKMPGMNGILTLQCIKDRWPEIEVVLLSGHVSIDTAIEGLQRGAFDYVLKPVVLEELVDKVVDAGSWRALNLKESSPGVSSGRQKKRDVSSECENNENT